MSKKQNDPTVKDFIGAIIFLVGEIIGHIAKGLLFGTGFWWAFYLMMK